MALNLTAEQQTQVASRRKDPSKRPKVFNAKTGTDEVISEDFEAFVILLDTESKSSAIGWINAASDFKSQDEDRRAVMAEFLDSEFDSLAARTQEIVDTVGDFEKVKASITTLLAKGGSTVPQVQTLINNMSFLLGEYGEKLDRTINAQIVNRLVYKRYVEEADFEAVRKELRSYVTALLAY